MRLKPLSSFVRPLWEEARRGVPEPFASDPRAAGFSLATKLHGVERVMGGASGLINIGTLAFCARDRLLVHEMSREACEIVDAADLHALPPEMPTRLRSPWVIEVRGPDRETLCGNLISIGLYTVASEHFVVALTATGGLVMSKWTPRWGEAEIDQSVTLQSNEWINDSDTHATEVRHAVRFATILAVMLEASNTPLTMESEPNDSGPANIRGKDRGERRAWAYGKVSLSDRARIDRAMSESEQALNREGLSSADVPVSGHLKRVPYGPEGSLRRWQWIDGYSARRWIAPAARVRVTN